MKAWVIAGVWFFGYLLTVFLLMLMCRLEGVDPEEVYGLDEGNVIIYAFLMLLWPLGFVIELLYFLIKFLRKWFVLIIETIIAVKEIKDEEED